MMRYHSLIATYLTLLLLSVVPVKAGVQVVPNRGGTMMTQPKSLDMRVDIVEGFAATTATWTFSNAQKSPFEAEFIAEAPSDAVVTGFSYWFKGKKVVARIVEKARAARIYSGVVEQQRDPALVEMLARNYFRARISPVEAATDLRIEVTWVQPLCWRGKELVYECPLWRDGEKYDLVAWNFSARIYMGSGFLKPSTNTDATVQPDDVSYSVTTTGKMPPATLEIRLPFGGKAFPELSAFSDYSMYRATVSAKPPVPLPVKRPDFFTLPLKAGGGYLTVGNRHIRINGRPMRVPYGSKGNPEQTYSHIAEKLWAAQKIDDLCKKDENYNAVLKLSTRFGLPSRWTSWLAIPDEERWRLRAIIEEEKRAQARSNMDALGYQMAVEVAGGRERRRGYALMKRQFVANCRIVEADPKEELQRYFSDVLANINKAIGIRGREYYYPPDNPVENLSKVRQLYVQIMRLGRRVPSKNRPGWSRNAEAEAREAMGSAMAEVNVRDYLKRVAAGRPASGLQAILERGAPPRMGRRARLAGMEVAVRRLAKSWAQEKAKLAPNAKVVQILQSQLDRVDVRYRQTLKSDEQSSGYSLKHIISSAEYDAFSPHIYNLKNALALEILEKREGGARAEQIRFHLKGLQGRLSQPLEELDGIGESLYTYIEKNVKQLALEQSYMKVDAQKISALKSELQRIERSVPQAAYKRAVESGERKWGYDAPAVLAYRWRQARYGDRPDPNVAQFYATSIQNILDKIYPGKKEKSSDASYFEYWQAERALQEAESLWLAEQSSTTIFEVVKEQSALRPNEAKIASLTARLEELEAKTLFSQIQNDKWVEEWQGKVFSNVLEHLRKEYDRPHPDAVLVADLEKRVIALEVHDGYSGQGSWSMARKIADPTEYGTLRVKRIAVRAEHIRAASKLAKTPDDVTQRKIVAELARQENELTVRMGDPLIAVVAPADCQQVIAILPFGEIKKLTYNPSANQWEARFDVPDYYGEDQYTVTIVVVTKEGARQILSMNFRVDMSSPEGWGRVQTQGKECFLSVQTGQEADRVEALLPWGERVDLKREGELFQAAVTIPDIWHGDAGRVVYVVTDRAHNRTNLEVSLGP